MTSRPTALERAFELARTGDYVGVNEIRNRLVAEGLQASQLYGRALTKQLRDLCLQARRDRGL